jgi:oligopeptide transport system ATP-binding protein
VTEAGAPSTPILEVEGLRCTFHLDDGEVEAVRGVSFALKPGEKLAIVGESGSGKSVTNLALLGLVDRRAASVSGAVKFQGEALDVDDESRMRSVRGREIAMIFQDPMSSLNPFLTVERQLTEVLEVHEGLSRRKARVRIVEMLERVGIGEAARRARQYPHQFSGGMRQRVMIAMALLCRPKILIADEPTTALDVTIQAQILDLVRGLAEDFGTSIIFITHDLGVVAGLADRVAVMYAGRVVETGPTAEVFESPAHPYTRALLASVPRLTGEREELKPVGGAVPSGAALPSGCAFHPRCVMARPSCAHEEPLLTQRSPGHRAACPFEADDG